MKYWIFWIIDLSLHTLAKNIKNNTVLTTILCSDEPARRDIFHTKVPFYTLFRFNNFKIFVSDALVWMASSMSWDTLSKSTWLPLLKNSGFQVLNPPCSFHVYKQRVEIKKERKKSEVGKPATESRHHVFFFPRKKVKSYSSFEIVQSCTELLSFQYSRPLNTADYGDMLSQSGCHCLKQVNELAWVLFYIVKNVTINCDMNLLKI